jgi:hypothetical protein
MGETSIRSLFMVITIGLYMLVLLIVNADASISSPLPPCRPYPFPRHSAFPPCLVTHSPLDDRQIVKHGKFGKSGAYKYCIKWARKKCKSQISSVSYRICSLGRLKQCITTLLS